MLKIHEMCCNYLLPKFATRFYGKAGKTVENSYSKTVLLPQTKFPSRLNGPKRIEMDNYLMEKCKFNDLYNWQRENLTGPDFVLHDGPPYANGDPHMGHAINKILKDITIRSRVIRGQRIHFVPGWDCHGLPIELKALEALKIKHIDELTPLEIRQLGREFADKTIKNQRQAFISWGVMADWKDSGCYFTNKTLYMANQMEQFINMYEKKLIFRDFKPVYWSPSSKTALAESEIEYNQHHKSDSALVRFLINHLPDKLKIIKDKPVYGLTWTTTPWTLIANQALAYSNSILYCIAQDENNNYYILAEDLLVEIIQKIGPLKPVLTISGNDLAGAHYIHPINKLKMPFLPANHVSNKVGTGLVHTAPAHGADDFLVALANNIPVISLVDENGCYTPDAGDCFSGLDVLSSGNDVILQHIGNHVLHREIIEHSYPYDWRTKKPVITRASSQWFIDTESIKEKAIEAIEQVEFYPKVRETIAKNNLIRQVIQRPYWCISRQRVWGTPIPVFYHKNSGEIITNKEMIQRFCRLLDRDGCDFWWKLPVEKLIGKKLLEKYNLNADELDKGKDIMDIWFDSGISWSTVLPDKCADIYLEGMDQFNGWFQSSLLTSIALQGKSPFKSIFAHGFTVDEKGLKMAKSLGNVVSPDDITKGKQNLKENPAYGIDTLRWWVASHGVQHSQIPVSKNILKDSSECVQKIRLILRFLLGALHPYDTPSNDGNINNNNIKTEYTIIDKYMLHRLYQFNNEIISFNNRYEYNTVSKVIINFVANDISAFYCHLIKDRLYCEQVTSPFRIAALDVIGEILAVLTRSIAPIVPHLAEEVWLYHPDNLASVPLYHSAHTVPENWNAPHLEKIINTALNVKTTLNKLTNSNTLELNANITVDEGTFADLSILHPEQVSLTSELCNILQVSKLTLLKDEKSLKPKIELHPIEGDLCKRCRKYPESTPGQLCIRCFQIVK